MPTTRRWSVPNGTAPNLGMAMFRPPLPTAKLVVLSLQCCPAPPASRYPGCSPPMMPGSRPLCTRLAICLFICPPGARLITEAMSAWPRGLPMLAPWPLTGDVRTLISGPLPRYPKCRSLPDVLHEGGWGMSVGASQRLRCTVHPTVLSCHCLPSSLPLLPSSPALVRSRMPTVPRAKMAEQRDRPEQNKHYLDGCLLYS